MTVLPMAPKQYDQAAEQAMRSLVERALNERFAKGADIELGRGSAIVWTDSAGVRWRATLLATGQLDTNPA